METMEVCDTPAGGKKAVRMKVPYVTSFCGCFGLEVGTKLVGLLHLVVSVSLLVVSSRFALQVGSLAGTAEDAGDHLYTTMHRIAVTVVALTVGHVLLAVTLLCGAFMRSTLAVRVWVYAMCVLLVAGLAYLIVTAAMFGVRGTGTDIFLAVLEGTLLYGVISYCILTVHSYYLMLRSSEEMDSPRKEDY